MLSKIEAGIAIVIARMGTTLSRTDLGHCGVIRVSSNTPPRNNDVCPLPLQ